MGGSGMVWNGVEWNRIRYPRYCPRCCITWIHESISNGCLSFFICVCHVCDTSTVLKMAVPSHLMFPISLSMLVGDRSDSNDWYDLPGSIRYGIEVEFMFSSVEISKKNWYYFIALVLSHPECTLVRGKICIISAYVAVYFDIQCIGKRQQTNKKYKSVERETLWKFRWIIELHKMCVLDFCSSITNK